MSGSYTTSWSWRHFELLLFTTPLIWIHHESPPQTWAVMQNFCVCVGAFRIHSLYQNHLISSRKAEYLNITTSIKVISLLKSKWILWLVSSMFLKMLISMLLLFININYYYSLKHSWLHEARGHSLMCTWFTCGDDCWIGSSHRILWLMN